MKTIYGPLGWNAREAAEASGRDLDMQEVIELGEELWAKLGEEPHADAFWNTIAPLVHALAAKRPEEAGYAPGHSAATACEQLMHKVGFRREREIGLNEDDNFGFAHLRRIDEIANLAFEDLSEIPTTHAELEPLIQAQSAAAERLSAVTYEMLEAEEDEAMSAGGER